MRLGTLRHLPLVLIASLAIFLSAASAKQRSSAPTGRSHSWPQSLAKQEKLRDNDPSSIEQDSVEPDTPDLESRETRASAAKAASSKSNTPASEASRKLPKRRPNTSPKKAMPTAASTDKALTTVVSALAVVLGLFLVFVWFTKRTAPKSASALPGEVVEVLGRAPLNAKQQMQLVRLGNRLLLLAMSSESAETLAEISDPDEVERLTAICRQNAPGSVTDTFRQVLAEMGNGPTRGGFIDSRDGHRSRIRANA